jgi:hypothetical protein
MPMGIERLEETGGTDRTKIIRFDAMAGDPVR